MKKIGLIFLVLISFSINSCVTEIDFELESIPERLVVNGIINTLPGPYIIQLSRSATFGDGTDNIQPPLSDAVVVVKDDLDNSYPFIEAEAGTYISDSASFQAVIGRTYTLEVITPDNGRRDVSRPETVYPVPPIDDIRFEVNRGTIRLFVKTTLPNRQGGSYLRWKTDGVYEFLENTFAGRVCYVDDRIDFNTIAVAGSPDFATELLDDQEILIRPVDRRFARKYSFNIRQQSISENAWRFWNSADIITDQNGSIFDPPPAKIVGNMYNPDDEVEEVLGLFMAHDESLTHYFVEGSEVGSPSPPCGGSPFGETDPGCRDCTSLNNSTTIPPDYWE